MPEKEKKIPKPMVDKTGEHYGHWIVIRQDIEKSQETGRIHWLCECDCGCGLQKTLRTDTLSQIKVGGCSNVSMSISKQCAKCQKIFYPKKQAKTRRYCYECMPETEQITGANTRRIIKKWALEYKGNKCSLCGYNKCQQALEFHHLDPNEKDFSLSDRNIKLDWEEIKKELEKCILICSNCHREIHAGLRTNDGKEVSNENANT